MFSFTKYSQQDPQWKNAKLGFDASATIGSLGCLLTDLAMAATGFGYAETPLTLDNKLLGLGPNSAFVGKMVVPAYLPYVLPRMVFRDFLDCHRQAAPMERIDAALTAGYPVIVEVDYTPTAGLQSHWLLLYGKQGEDYLLQDPWPFPPDPQPVLLSNSRYAFAGEAAEIIEAVVWLEGPLPAVNKPDGAVSVYTIEDALALRSQPIIDPQNLVRRLPLLSELYSLESLDVTLHKVGAASQWLKVQAAQGEQGFVAAWYLNLKREVPGSLVVMTLPDDQSLRVYTTVDQLALRGKPVVESDNLLKRLALGCELRVLDPLEQAAPKVGMVNAWLNVRDPAGVVGYVAAWYTTLTCPVSLGPAVVLK
jgi:hypothetical protein